MGERSDNSAWVRNPRVRIKYETGFTFCVLGGLQILSAASVALAVGEVVPAWIVWFALSPFFLAAIHARPLHAAICGGVWGGSLYGFLVLQQVSHVSPDLKFGILLTIAPASYAFLLAAITRFVGFNPLFAGLAWVGLELALRPLSLPLGLLTPAHPEPGLAASLTPILGYAFVSFLVASVNAYLAKKLAGLRLSGHRSRWIAGSGLPEKAWQAHRLLVSARQRLFKIARGPPGLSAWNQREGSGCMTTKKVFSKGGKKVFNNRSQNACLLALLVGCFTFGSSVNAQRPTLLPGQSNWTPPQPAGGGTLPTTDMSALTPADLVTALVGPGVTVSNITLNCANVGAGTFSGGTGIIGFENGIVLSSGNIASVGGPDNLADGTTTNNGTGGDADLAGLIPGFSILDACVLEFDFECSDVQVVQFQYTFTSEEYNEYAFTLYNDVFGFFLNGSNIALVPGGPSPVSIDNVNCGNPYNPPLGGNNCTLFINNDCSDIPPNTFPCSTVDTEMDGLTTVFTATGNVLPGVNHIKLAIADAGDTQLDSNVFIKGQSFQCALPTGACCDRAALDCSENVLEADCQGASMEWYVGLTCDQIDPACEEPAVVPAVSEWGLLVLTLVGLIVGTTMFGQRMTRPKSA